MCIMQMTFHAFRHEHCLRCPCNLAVYFHVLQCSCLTLQRRRYDMASRQAISHLTELPNNRARTALRDFANHGLQSMLLRTCF